MKRSHGKSDGQGILEGQFKAVRCLSMPGDPSMSDGRSIISLIAQRQDLEQFRKKTRKGSFEQYLDVVRAHPEVPRNALQRRYDMIMSYGILTYERCLEIHVRYRGFQVPVRVGQD